MSNSNVEQLLSDIKVVITITKGLVAACTYSDKDKDFILHVEKVTETLEKAVLTSRNTLERLRPAMEIPKMGAPCLPYISISGMVRIIEYNWLHIKLNTLLPHCRFQTPHTLSISKY